MNTQRLLKPKFNSLHLFIFVGHTSRSFFSKLTPDVFIQFMLLLGQIERLPVDFHKYYTLYKFFEFVHELNLGINENYVICCKQAVIVSCYKNGSKADLNNLV